MKAILQVKLIPTEHAKDSLLNTMKVFNEACNYVSEIAFNTGTTGKFKLQKLVYHELKSRFGLTAQMAVLVVHKVSAAYKKSKDVLREFKATGAITYDSRIMRFKGVEKVNLWTVAGRQDIPIRIGEYQKTRWFQTKGQADLVFVNNAFYLLVTVDVPEDTPLTPKAFIGVDLGVVNIATTSDGDPFCGKALRAKREKYLKLRARLQRKGTKSAKRHLKRISKRESNFRKDTNHVISKELVETAKGSERGIGLENLKDIRKRITVRKSQRAEIAGWSFYQLQQFIEYKAGLSGVPVIYVEAAYTSQECPHCGHTERANRRTQSRFSCVSCGYAAHADVVGARNVRKRVELSAGLSWRSMIHTDVGRPAASFAL
jgi:IS605 OrfB family transposase